VSSESTVSDYWIKSARMDLQTARNLLACGEFSWSLFIGHLVLEKMLKACYAARIEPKVPYRHGLVLLAKEIGLAESEIEFLDIVTSFNIAVRYPDAKFQFHRQCTEAFAREYLEKIAAFASRLEEQIRDA